MFLSEFQYVDLITWLNILYYILFKAETTQSASRQSKDATQEATVDGEYSLFTL